MALLFYDAFDRADGPPGNDYSSEAGVWSISGNKLYGPGNGRLRWTGSPQGPNVCAVITVPAYVSAGRTYGLRVRQNANGTSYVYASFTVNDLSVSVTLSVYVNSAQVFSSSKTQAMAANADTPIRVAAIGDRVWCWYGDYMLLACYQNSVQANGSVVILNSTVGQLLDDFWVYDYGASAGLIDVVADEQNPGHYELTLHNIGPEWTPGTPGSPAFSCRSGTISSQEVTDEDTAVIQWVAPEIETDEEIWDPGYESFYQFDLTAQSGVAAPSGEGGGLTETQAQTLTDLATYLEDYAGAQGHESSWWFKLAEVIEVARSESTSADPDMLSKLFYQINDNSGSLRLAEIYGAQILDLLNDTTDAGNWTLQYVWGQIKGEDNVDNTALADAIAALGTASNTDLDAVLAELAAIRTASLWTLEHVRQWILDIPEGSNADVLQELAVIRTANLWTLGHVMDAIDAITIPDYSSTLTDIHGDIAAIPTNPITSLQPVLDAISTHDGELNTHAQAILDAIGDIPTDPITSLQTVLDAISALDTLVDGYVSDILEAIAALAGLKATNVPPTWPGAANATLGTPIAITSTMTVTQACHGVIVDITSDDLHKGLYDWGDVSQHPRAAYIAFKHDSGAYEQAQTVTFPSECITPTKCQQATGFIFRARNGLTGTITPWSINAP